jgi:dienelactone hydrolase
MFTKYSKMIILGMSLLIGILLISGCTSGTPTLSSEIKETEETMEATAYPVETLEETIFEETEGYPVEAVVEGANTNPLSPEPVSHTIQTSDGIDLQGTFYPAEVVNAPLIVLMHWAGGDQGDWMAIAPWLQNRGVQPEVTEGVSWLNPEWFPVIPEGVSFNVFTFTFRGCEGGCQSIEPEGWLLDIQVVMAYIRGLENVDLSRVATIGASIGADGAAVGCDAFNADTAGCLGALSLSPGGYLKDSYPDEVVRLETATPPVPAWCLYAVGDTRSASACQNATGDLYQSTEYEGSAHGMTLLTPEFDPNPLVKVLEFLNTIGLCDTCP